MFTRWLATLFLLLPAFASATELARALQVAPLRPADAPCLRPRRWRPAQLLFRAL